MNKRLVKNGLIAAALMNIGGVLIFSRAFSNVAVNQADPVVMSNFGLVMIAVWGLAYLGAATISSNIKMAGRRVCGGEAGLCGGLDPLAFRQ